MPSAMLLIPLITFCSLASLRLLPNSFNSALPERLILQAVLAQDLYLVMASLVMGAVMLIVGNLLADCC